MACSSDDVFDLEVITGGVILTGGIAGPGETGGTPAATGGTMMTTGGAPATTGGVAANTGGSPAATGGMAMIAGGMMMDAGSATATGGMIETGGAGPDMREDLGEGDGQDVITIGDSWMNLILSGIEQSLERASMRDYRNYAVPGTLVLNEQIPGQYAQAVADDPDIMTVVMTGGGNDILTSPCADSQCEPIVDDVSNRLTELMLQMEMDGVQDVFLIGYTYPADARKHASLDYSIMLSGEFCVPTTLPRCHFIDSTMLDITLAVDGIHPDAASYDLLGETVWERMQATGARR